MADGLLNKASIILTPTGYKAGTLYNVAPVVEPYEDFDFSRASVASRVNSSGLVEMVGRTLGSELVTNGDFSELGSELVTNGDFATDSDWTLGTSWSIGDGKATSDGGASYLTSSSSFRWTVGKTYKVSLEITEYNSGSVSLPFDGIGANTNYQNSSGVKTAYIVAGANNPIYIYSSGFNGSIDNVSVKQVDPNDYWSTTGSWGIVNNQAEATANSTSQYLQQNFSITNGNVYKFSYEIIENTLNGNGASLSSSGGFGSVSLSNVVGTHTEYITASNDSATYALKIGVSGTATSGAISIDNVSVKEVIENDVPRLDYSGGASCASLLLEPQRTNLITYSESFDNAYWTKSGSSVVGGFASPSADSPLGAFKLVATTNDPYIYKTGLNVTANAQTASIYVKGVGSSIGKEGRLLFWYIGTAGGTTLSVPFTLTSDWQRVQGSTTPTSGGTIALRIDLPDASVVGEEVLIYGAQLEQGSYATSYIPTSGSTVTRTADVCTNAGTSATFNDSEGVLFAEILKKQDDNTNFILISLNNDASNSDANSVTIGFSSDDKFYFRVKSPSGSYGNQGILSNENQFYKVALKYKSGDIAIWIDGVETDTSTNSFSFAETLDNLSFDFNGNGTLPFYGNTKQLIYFDEALSDEELSDLTGQANLSFNNLATFYNYTIL